MKRHCLYTCNYGNYDFFYTMNQISEEFFEDNVDYYYFTDNKDIKLKNWKMIYDDLHIENYRIKSRITKILIPDILKSYEKILYMDANVRLISPISHLFDMVNKNNIICFKTHPDRSCTYDEIDYIIENNIDRIISLEKIQHQREKFVKEKFPKNFGLMECNFFIRYNCKETNDFCQKWLMDVLECGRDQTSVMFHLWKNKIPYVYFDKLEDTIYKLSHRKSNSTLYDPITSIDLIIMLVKKHNYQSYLEIGTGKGSHMPRIKCSIKHKIFHKNLPRSYITHIMSTDDFFPLCNTKYDIIFIDRNKREKTKRKIISESMKILSDDGMIIINDITNDIKKCRIIQNGKDVYLDSISII